MDKWFAENTYHADEFADLDALLDLKRQRGLTISLALPALNEEATVGNVIRSIKGPLMEEVPLIDELVLIDSRSTDRTVEIARSLGVPVFVHQDILPEYGPVSYTHLDVYKRQSFRWARSKWPVGFTKTSPYVYLRADSGRHPF